MASRASAEDVESSAEFERIKQNFRSTLVAPEVPANLPEAQATFQELQIQLEQFLTQHISKITALQGLLASNLVRGGRGAINTVADDPAPPKSRRGTSTSVHLHPPDAEVVDPIVDVPSHEAGSNLHSRRSSIKDTQIPIDGHVHALQTFLDQHLETIRTLQSSMHSNSPDEPRPSPIVPLTKDRPPVQDSERNLEGYAQQLSMVVLVSAVMIVFIVAFLVLVKAVIGTGHETPFNVGLFFGFFALAFHLIDISVAGRSARIIRYHAILSEQDRPELDPLYFKFYLVICEQLQFVGSLFFFVSIMIMIFLIFSSYAFPLLLIFLTGIAGLVVFSSAYCKVAITLENVIFLAKNLHRLGWRTLDYVQTNIGTRRHPHV
ncbi:hypothetical protein NLJ89_g5543 [Agrocybe chaxingu]|uniref:Uncharacterized protein n=1 Tax=Agrocybe chaxingu TaxID=84603 RepID=A0A9W8K0K6_9AGAR|nr:hypothetical protein NLJ89_g5543 [Agrocybe chaxingu]